MAEGYAKEVQGVLDGTKAPPGKADGALQNARVRRYRATLDLTDAAVKKASGDTNVLFVEPAGYYFAYAHVQGPATATATIALGVAGSPAKYGAAAAIADTKPVLVMPAVAPATVVAKDTPVIMTIGTAALPGAGVITIDCYYSGR